MFGIEVGEKQTLWLRVRAKGTAAHGSQPIPDNANVTLLTALEKAMALPPGQASSGGGRDGPQHRRAARREQVHRGDSDEHGFADHADLGRRLARQGNVIPSTAEATLDCRLLPGVNCAEFISEMKARINDPRVSIEVINPPEDPGVEQPHAAVRGHAPGDPEDASGRRRDAHAGSARHRFEQAARQGSDRLRPHAHGARPIHRRLHAQRQEHIPVAEFQKGIRIFYDVLAWSFEAP